MHAIQSFLIVILCALVWISIALGLGFAQEITIYDNDWRVKERHHLGEYLKAFRLVDCQVGALFAVDGKIVGLECFGYQKTFGSFFLKLVQSYALDVLDWLTESKETQAPTESARRFLEGLRNVPGKSYPSLGLGENLRFEDNFFSGAALVHEGRLLHLSAFKNSRESRVKSPESGVYGE